MLQRILLIQPSHYKTNVLRPVDPDKDLEYFYKCLPLNIISLANVILHTRHSVELLDCRFSTDEEIFKNIDSKIKGCTIVGISAMTKQMAHGLVLAEYIKKKYGLPVIWGGVHTTLFPKVVLDHPHADYIIAGEAEYSLVEFLDWLETGNRDASLLNRIKGLGYKKDGVLNINSEFPVVEDINKLPEYSRKLYELLDIEKYIVRRLYDNKLYRTFDLMTSRGCPYRCAFCLTKSFFPRKWRGIEPASILHQMKELIDNYHIEYFYFMEDYFFGNRTRMKKIVSGFIDNQFNIRWCSTARSNIFNDDFLSDDTMDLIKRSGCAALRFGFESGSDRMLGIYRKGITVAETLHAVERLTKYGIIPTASFMMGAPGETTSEVKQTYSLIWKIHKINKRFPPESPGIFRPYPGCDLYNEILKTGFNPPATLEEWGLPEFQDDSLVTQTMTWFKDKQFLVDMRFYGLCVLADYKGEFNQGILRLFKILVFFIKIRYETGFWSIRIEARLYLFFKRLLARFPKFILNKYFRKL